MKLPKKTRKLIYEAAAKHESVEIALPRSEECRAGQAYAVEGDKGGKRLATIFVEALERRGQTRYAMVRLTDEPRLLARQQGLRTPQQYTTSEIAALPQDPGEAVDEETQRRLTTEGRDRFAQHRAEIAVEEDKKAQARRARSKLSEALSGLDGPARVAWLAEFERMCERAKEQPKAA